ncbi:hypothetical protein Tco_0318215 [Tanacetum coccineum]
MEDEAQVSREAWVQAIGCSATIHYELQAYRSHTQIQDLHISLQEALTATLVAQKIASRRGNRTRTRTTPATATTPMTDAAIRALIA